jgi:NADH-ubiquinone reductase complex 1 MLRQ subunit
LELFLIFSNSLIYSFISLVILKTWPVAACIIAACGWTTYNCVRHLFYSPDVSLDRVRRQSTIKNNHTNDGEVWIAGHKKFYSWASNDIKIFGTTERNYERGTKVDATSM